MTLKKILNLKSCVLFIALPFCATAQAESYTTAVDATYAPHAMRNLSGKLVGFNIDLADELAKEMGTAIAVDGVEWNAVIPGLNSKKYDFVVAPMTVTPELANSMLFTEGYLDSEYAFVVKKNTEDIKRAEDLYGKLISVNKGNPMERWLQANQEKYGYKFESFGTNADAVQAVISGRAYANMATLPVVKWAAKQNPLLKSATFTIKSGNVIALGFRKDDEALRGKFSNAIKCLKIKGVFIRLSEKWLAYTPGSDSVAVKVGTGTGIPNLPGYIATPVSPACAK
jgi:polar amino acid transport system substrate-binding protein